jgi:hypothetical protein
MRLFRLVLASPQTEFVIYEYGINEHTVVDEANEQYGPEFVVLRDMVTEIIK